MDKSLFLRSTSQCPLLIKFLANKCQFLTTRSQRPLLVNISSPNMRSFRSRVSYPAAGLPPKFPAQDASMCFKTTAFCLAAGLRLIFLTNK